VSAELAAQADRAAASGDLKTARTLTQQLAESDPGRIENWLKLAALSRADGDMRAALVAVHRALEIAPLDFVALLLRANLLDKLGDPGAGEAFANAMAQRPESPPPQLAAAIRNGETRHAALLQLKEGRLVEAMADAEADATPEEARRIARFRDNALRKTRPFHSEPTHFHFPGLIEREFHDRAAFPWLAELEAATADIAAELEIVMAAERAELTPYIRYAAHVPVAQWKELNHSKDWTAIHLLKNGRRVDANAQHCPRTMALLDRIVQPVIPGASPNAMFSLLAPHTRIPPHVGVNNSRLVCHLPLIVPAGCWFRVGAETRDWTPGEAFVFDDTIEHEAMNPTDELRIVFIIDTWHPGLSATEREAVTALIAADISGRSAGAIGGL
jgi:aspartyl/asparaginyl beta-hydroxylase (cupin superfamily)